MKRIFIFFVCCSIVLSCSKEKDTLKPNLSSALHPTGALKEMPSKIELVGYYKFKNLLKTLPASTDLSAYIPNIGDQGYQGSCVGWATGYYCKTYQEALKRGWDKNYNAYSPSWIYNQINFGVDNGSYVSDALDLIVNNGCDFLRNFGYDQYNWTAQPDDNSFAIAANYKAKSWQFLQRDVNTLKQVLANGQVFVFTIPVYPDFDYISSSNQVYDNTNGALRGYHALCMIGYDDSKQAFKFVNSWGSSWGLNGFGWISYNLLTSSSFPSDAYLLVGDTSVSFAYNLIAIKKANTGTASTEVHILSGASMFQNFILQTGTALHETGSTFDFCYGDYNRDGVNDLIAISKSGTGTGTTEVHVLNGANNFQSFILNTGTALHETGDNFKFLAGDYNLDGYLDIYAIKKSATGSNSTEVHVLNGADNYQSFILHTGTALHETGDSFDFDLFDYNHDNYLDLVCISKSGTGTGTTELHVLDGASGFSNFSLHTGTALHETGSTFEFQAVDIDKDGNMDMVALSKSSTGSGNTEIHVLSGASSFQSFSYQIATGLHATDDTFKLFIK